MATPSAANSVRGPTTSSPSEQIEEDIITRIQTNLDQLATQFYASVRYLSTHHPLLDFDGTPLNEATGLPLHPAGQQPQTPGLATTPGATTAAADADIAGQEKKSKKDKKDKTAKDDGEGPEPPAKPPLSPDWTPMEPDPFALDITELAGDLITKQKQIEELLHQLPQDLEQEEQVQERRIRELVGELESLEGGITEARRGRDKLLSKVEGVIEAVGRRGGG